MRSLSSIGSKRTHRVPRRIPDARISMTTETLVIEYSNGMDLVLATHDSRAQQVINFIKLR